MTVQQMIDEVRFIEKENEYLRHSLKTETNIQVKAEHRTKLMENNHQLLHLKSTLTAVKCDPLF